MTHKDEKGTRMRSPESTDPTARHDEREARDPARRLRILAAVAWLIGTAQFFVAQLVVEAAWDTPFSWAHNNISDLAETGCHNAPTDGRWICSPLYPVMNISFVLTGVFLVLGSLLLMKAMHGNTMSRIAFSALALTGVGWVLVGIYPADINENMHVLGALVIFVVGNAALVFGSGSPQISTMGQISSIVLGLIGFAAAFLHFGGTYLGLGMGGMERVTAYPVSIWTAVIALLLLAGGRRWR
jgi:hypothetical membrane protein